MISLAKPLSAGYLPISALMINERVHAALVEMSARNDTFGHGFTYGGHPVCAAVALEALHIYEELQIAQRVRNIADYFRRRLTSLVQHPLVGDVRTIGLLGALEIVRCKETREGFEPSSGIMSHFGKQMQQHGVITRWGARAVNVCPPLLISEAQIDDLVMRLRSALDDTWAWSEAKDAT
jgi:4-aminobutyrate--pyruvate transaminase